MIQFIQFHVFLTTVGALYFVQCQVLSKDSDINTELLKNNLDLLTA